MPSSDHNLSELTQGVRRMRQDPFNRMAGFEAAVHQHKREPVRRFSGQRTAETQRFDHCTVRQVAFANQPMALTRQPG